MGTTSASRADAATAITVNTTSDETVTDGQCSLREAINNANANADTTGGDCLAGSLGVVTIDISSLSGTILLSIPNDFGRSTLPTITDALTFTGPGSSALTIKQTGLGRVIRPRRVAEATRQWPATVVQPVLTPSAPRYLPSSAFLLT